MSLTGTTVEQQIWNYLKGKGLNDYGIAGLMGNLYAESGLKPTNLQNSFERKLGMTDDSYTKAVDNGSYANFVNDSAGYGLCQWTYWSRKQGLINFVKSRKCSIGDLEGQLEFLYKELSESYKTVLNELKSATSVRAASDAVFLNFERPADQSVTVQEKRAGYGLIYFEKYAKAAKTAGNGGFNMSNSPLVDVTVLSPNHSGKRTKAISRITPHCVVGQLTAEGIGACFPKGREASCNYGIGTEGRVALIVDEANRSWCSSSNDNDQQAVTIECASDKAEPYAFNSKVYNRLVDLCVDICKRNGKKKLLWFGDKDKTLAYSPKSDEMVLTVHRWFANKSCPGNWMYARMGELAEKVTAALGGSKSTATAVPTASAASGDTVKTFPAVPFTVQVVISDLCIRKSPAMGDNKTGQYTGKGTFTIVEVQNGWGRLKSGAGWIWLENPAYCTVKGSVAQNAATTDTTAAAAKKSIEVIAKEVIQGKWGNGADRKKKLETAGYNYAQVQAMVNKLLK